MYIYICTDNEKFLGIERSSQKQYFQNIHRNKNNVFLYMAVQLGFWECCQIRIKYYIYIFLWNKISGVLGLDNQQPYLYDKSDTLCQIHHNGMVVLSIRAVEKIGTIWLHRKIPEPIFKGRVRFGAGHFGTGTIGCQNFFFRFVFL